MLFALTSLVDCVAVLGLAWLVKRVERRHALVMAEQQAVLERLRGAVADLLADAERRGRALDQDLAAREAGLRRLLELPVRPAPGAAAERRLVRDVERALGADAAGEGE